MPSSGTRSRLSPFLERLLSSAWSACEFSSPKLLTPGRGSVSKARLQTRRGRELERQRQHALFEHLLRQPKEAAALSVAAGAIADRGHIFGGGGEEDSDAAGQLAAAAQDARKVSRSKVVTGPHPGFCQNALSDPWPELFAVHFEAHCVMSDAARSR